MMIRDDGSTTITTKTTSETTTIAAVIRAIIAPLDEPSVTTMSSITTPQAHEATGPIRTGTMHPKPGPFLDRLPIDRVAGRPPPDTPNFRAHPPMIGSPPTRTNVLDPLRPNDM
jgi:hypothetical protein